MPVIKETELKQRIAQGQFSNVYFFYGPDHFFIVKYAKAIIKKVVAKQFESFNLQWFHGDKLVMDELQEAIESLPMMAKYKCVVVQNLNMDALSKADYAQLKDILKFLNETTILIFFADKIVYDVKRSSRFKTITNQISKAGVVCEFQTKNKDDLKRALCEKARKASMELDMDVADYMIDRCSMNYAILMKELEKIIDYVNGCNQGREITKQIIDTCCIPSMESTVFQLASAIIKRKYQEAFSILDELFFQRQEPIAILAVLDMCFYDIYRGKLAYEQRIPMEQVKADFEYSPERKFAIENGMRDSRSYSTAQIRTFLDILTQSDVQLKSTKADGRLVLEQMIAKMIACNQRN